MPSGRMTVLGKAGESGREAEWQCYGEWKSGRAVESGRAVPIARVTELGNAGQSVRAVQCGILAVWQFSSVAV